MRTYTFNSVNTYGGRRDGINMSLQGFDPAPTKRVGYYSSQYAAAVSMFFDTPEYFELRNKIINHPKNELLVDVKLVVNSSDTFAYSVPIIYSQKKNSSSVDWAVLSGYSTKQCPRYGKIPDLTLYHNDDPEHDSPSYHDFSDTVPASGAFVVGGYYRTNSYVTVTDAVLTIVTDETYGTILYDANGGENAPDPTLLWSSYVSKSGNLTNDIPTRLGYEFVEWNTNRDGSGTSYDPGDLITISNITVKDTITLYAQWEALSSKITSAPDTDIGSQITIGWTNYVPGCTNKIKFVFGSISTSEIDVTGSSYSYTIPNAWLNEIPNAVSGKAVVYLYTYVNGELIGYDSDTFYASAPSNIVPSIGSISASKVNENETVDIWDIYLQNYSKVLVSVSGCVAGQGASIAYYQFLGQNLNVTNQTDNSSSNAESDVIEISGNLVYTVKIVDSRGRSATASITIAVNPYFNPFISSVTAIRSDSNGTPKPVTGTSISFSSVFAFAAVGNNALTTDVSYKKHPDQNYTLARTGIVSGTTYIIATDVTDIAFSYDVKVTVSDSLGNFATFVVVVPPVIGIGFGLKNDRARFGGPTEGPGFRVDWSAIFNDDVEVNGDAEFNGNAEFNGEVEFTDDVTFSGAVHGAIAPVTSVNNKTGDVVLDANDVGALPDTYTPPVSSVNGNTGAVILDANDVGAVPSTAQLVESVNGKSGTVSLGIADLGEVVNLEAGASYAFNLEGGTRHIFFCIGAAENNVCGIVCGCSSTGTTRATKMGSASNITFTQGTYKLTIKSANYTCCVLHLSYDVPS